MLSFQVNYLAVLAGAAAFMVIGSLWYSPILFGNIWLKAKGIEKEDLKGAGKAMAFATISGILTALGLAIILKNIGVDNLVQGIIVSLVIFFGYSVAYGILEVVYDGKKLSVFFINMGYFLVSLVVNSIILVLWK